MSTIQQNKFNRIAVGAIIEANTVPGHVAEALTGILGGFIGKLALYGRL